MKKKILLSSIVTIALCLCMIAGSTFALFTGTAETNIVVKSGKVELSASVVNFDNPATAPQLFSISPVSKADAFDADGNLNEGVIVQTGEFEYEDGTTREETFYYTKTNPYVGTTFPNGGTASVDNNEVVTFTNITPGDGMLFNVAGVSTSNVNTKVRYVIKPNFDDAYANLVGDFVVSYGDEKYDLTSGGVVVSGWESVLAGESFLSGSALGIELKASAGNEYQNKSFSFVVIVEAVQDNAAVN